MEIDLTALTTDGFVMAFTPTLNEYVALGDRVRETIQSDLPFEIQNLEPKSQDAAKPNSLSGSHGLGAFPFHSDLVIDHLPPKFLLLRCDTGDESCPTVLNFMDRVWNDQDLINELRQGSWAITGARRPFYSSVICNFDDGLYLRWNEDCMVPRGKLTKSIQTHLLSAILASKQRAVKWAPGVTVVIDNWKLLHGRAPVHPKAATNRVLQRILIRKG